MDESLLETSTRYQDSKGRNLPGCERSSSTLMMKYDEFPDVSMIPSRQ